MDSSLQQSLKQAVSGEVRFDAATRIIYSVDASIYEIRPQGVVIPQNALDVVAAVKIAKAYHTPITPRGAATGITGGCIGTGIIIDTSKNLNKILDVDYDNETVVCQPGVVQDDLNHFLEPKGYRLGPDTSTGNRATIGGMLGNNAAGARSLFYGRMVDHVLEVEMVLSSGELVTFRELNEEALERVTIKSDTSGKIHKSLLAIRDEYAEEIKKRFPAIPRRVSGYNLDELIKSQSLNLSKVIVGSEGTLGVITQVKLRIAKRPKHVGFCILFLDDMINGMKEIEKILSYKPLSVEMIDEKIIAMGKLAPSMEGKLGWLEGSPETIFVVEFQGDTESSVREQVEMFRSNMSQDSIGYTQTTHYDTDTMAHVWALRKAGLGLLLSKRTYSRAIAFIEDISVPPKRLDSFMQAFKTLLKKHNKEAGVYGHVGSGCMHIRPYIDLRDPSELKTMETMMLEVSDLLTDHGGVLSGEHGDGYIRSWLNKKIFGEDLYQAFVKVKETFDPLNLMNPNKIVNGEPLAHDLRLSPETKHNTIKTFLNFDEEGGFELSADLCNGNATCRKPEKLMCPPFQATGDENHTTRARAQMLRSIINGKLPAEEFTGNDLYKIMDLCVECKGCKKECPSQVDMAKMKSEFLYHYHKRHGTPIRNYLFAYIGTINKILSPFASLFNKLTTSAINKKVLSFFNISPERPLPKLSTQKFSSWKKTFSPIKTDKKVSLFVDTYTEFNTPEIGRSAIAVLEALGFSVQIIDWTCCGRPMISKGMLPQAKKRAFALIETLSLHNDEESSIIILEPSCLSAVIDDYKSLYHDSTHDIEKISKQCISLEEFIVKNFSQDKIEQTFKTKNERTIHFHGHCHQKSLNGTEAIKQCLESIQGHVINEIPTGCCGIAGSFGYESEHYNLSMDIANLHLIPYINALGDEAIIIANGFSCRSQIHHGTGRKALHIAEYLESLIDTQSDS